jgi:hypothetical protein
VVTLKGNPAITTIMMTDKYILRNLKEESDGENGAIKASIILFKYNFCKDKLMSSLQIY